MACAEPEWDEIDEIWAKEERVNDYGVFCRFNPGEWTSGPDLVETVRDPGRSGTRRFATPSNERGMGVEGASV